jgi:hypothetical protein
MFGEANAYWVVDRFDDRGETTLDLQPVGEGP